MYPSEQNRGTVASRIVIAKRFLWGGKDTMPQMTKVFIQRCFQIWGTEDVQRLSSLGPVLTNGHRVDESVLEQLPLSPISVGVPHYLYIP